MKIFSKALVGTVAAAAVASSATPAMARDHRGGIDGGDIVAGALVIGGIAAIAAAASNNNNDRYGYGDWNDGRYDNRYGNRYGNRGNSRGAIEQCVRTAERAASRYSYGRADVTDVRDIRQTRWGDVRFPQPRRRGAVSRDRIIAPSPSNAATSIYQAGAIGSPVIAVSHAITNCVDPPNTDIATA